MVQLAANPHSSAENAEMVEETRKAVLRHFNTDNRHYDLIFTSGATASIKLVGETFCWSRPCSRLVIHQDSHTSVMGLRQLCRGAEHSVATDRDMVEMSKQKSGPSLFCFPAMSNF